MTTALDRLRATVPTWRDDYSSGGGDAYVHWFLLRRTATLVAVAWRMLRELTGALGALRALPGKEQVFVHALTVLVEPGARGEDLQALFRLWTDSPNPYVVDLGRVHSHGRTGADYFASLYGRSHTSPVSYNEQESAFNESLARAPDLTLAKARALVANKRRTAGEAESLRATLSKLARMPAPPSSEWIEVARASEGVPFAREVLEKWQVK